MKTMNKKTSEAKQINKLQKEMKKREALIAELTETIDSQNMEIEDLQNQIYCNEIGVEANEEKLINEQLFSRAHIIQSLIDKDQFAIWVDEGGDPVALNPIKCGVDTEQNKIVFDFYKGFKNFSLALTPSEGIEEPVPPPYTLFKTTDTDFARETANNLEAQEVN